MKVVIQRVKSASVSVDGNLVATIEKGLLAFAAIGKNDTVDEAVKSASKLLKMKLWDDEDGRKWRKNVQEIGGEVLCVSQFTLLASTKKGNRPDFHKSAGTDKARELYSAFFTKVQELHGKEKVKDGVFQAMMDVALVNDGPVGVNFISADGEVTIEINSDPPPMDLPPGSLSTSVNTTMSMEELGSELKRMSAEFKIPPELLE